MKIGSLKNFILIVFVIAWLLFIYVVTITEIKNMKNEKINKIELLNEKQNRIEMKLVQIQKLMSEDRIVKIAQDSLGLIRPTENLETLRISKEQIKRIEKFVNEKYD